MERAKPQCPPLFITLFPPIPLLFQQNQAGPHFSTQFSPYFHLSSPSFPLFPANQGKPHFSTIFALPFPHFSRKNRVTPTSVHIFHHISALFIPFFPTY